MFAVMQAGGTPAEFMNMTPNPDGMIFGIDKFLT
jgi:hypothetical protein